MTRKPRDASEEERALFEAAVGDAMPLKKSSRRRKKKSPTARGAVRVAQTVPEKKSVTRHRNTGVDGNTADRLRRGVIEPQARLDLHGLNLRDGHRTLVTFVRAAHARKLRLVLVVTGKGRESAGAPDPSFDLQLDTSRRGVLRTMTPRWLKEPGLAELIVHVSEAHRRHGGAGALYVYLRKHP